MHKIRHIIGAGLFGFVLLLYAGAALARNQVQIAGSSTVLPYARLAAEAFSEVYPEYKTPVIESGGSGAGIKEFCRGTGENTIDIATSSRAIKAGELQACAAAGVTAIEELCLGYDGVALAVGAGSRPWNIRPQDIYKALAAQIFVAGRPVANPYTTWREVNDALPAWDIAAYIPGEKHGTREVVEEKLLLQGCRDSGAYAQFTAAGFSAAAARQACIAVRKDGKAVDIDGDYSETLARLIANPTGLGVFGLSFYRNNADRLQLVAVDNVIPAEAAIASGRYAVSRPLYIYVKKAHIGVIPGLKDYVDFLLSDAMIGPDSPLAEYGLVPAAPAQRSLSRAAFAAGQIMIIPAAAPR